MRNRIVELREKLGWKQAELARRVGAHKSQIWKLENGDTQLNGPWLERLSKVLGVQPAEILVETLVPLLGYVGAGEEIFPLDDASEDTIEAPPGLMDGFAVRVSGESMLPVYRDGDIIFAEAVRDIDAAINRDCIVQIAGGARLVKRLVRGGAPGTYRLFSYATLETGDDVQVADVAVVRWVQRA